MKRLNPKALLVVVLLAVLLTFTVGGTLAYLFVQTDPVQNTFTPAKVDTEIEEEFDNNGSKTAIKITNPEATDSVDAYVRVAVVGNWYNEAGKIVDDWQPSFTPGAKWVKYPSDDPDAFYYYTEVLKVGETTTNLLADGETIGAADADGLHLQVTVMQQAIQAKGTDGTNKAVVDTWGVDPETLK